MKSMTRRGFLMGGAAATAALALASSPGRLLAQGAGPKRNLVVVLAEGGWDVTYALDPKPGVAGVDAPDGAVQMFGDLPILVHSSRPAVTDFFAAYAGISAVINGISVRSINHPECRKRILTGTPTNTSPDIGAITGYELGRGLPLPYLVLGDTAYSGPLAASTGRVGITNQLVALLDPDAAYPASGTPFPRFRPDAEDEALIREYVLKTAARQEATRGARGYNRARIEDFKSSLERGDLLRPPVSDGFGERGSSLPLASQIELAADVIEQGISHAVSVDTRLAWDTHQDNAPQGSFHQALFSALRALGQTLEGRPGKQGGKLLDETVVVVLSEMSRTPRQNATGGKDHWPVTSALVFGAGVRGGRAYGKTSDGLEAEPIDLATGDPRPDGQTLMTDNLAAGLLALVGVDPSNYLDAEAFHAIVA